MKARLLLIEDDVSVGYLLSEYLKIKGFAVQWVKNGKEALIALKTKAIDLAIIDIVMPEMDGFSFAEALQASNIEVPFIFLTSRSMKVDVLRGFALGAVDYLKKPIDEEELVVRIERLMTRIHKSDPSEKEKLFIGKYRFEPKNLTLSQGDHTRTLTGKERDVLLMLAGKKNQLCSHREILINLWGKNDYFTRKSLNVFITKLRNYLKDDPNVSIENMHNQGFILRD